MPAALREDRELAIGKHVHDAYSAIEKALERLLLEVDGNLPGGRHWHRDLLDRAARPVEGIREAILTQAAREGLGRLATFRHAYRHAYDAFRFDLAEPNVILAAWVVPEAAEAVTRFAREFGLAPPRA